MNVGDHGELRDHVGLAAKLNIKDGLHGHTVINIHRYDSAVFERQSKPYFEEEADCLAMAARALNAGNHEVWARYWMQAKTMRERGQRRAFNRTEAVENLGLNEGINLLTTLLCGGAGTAFSNANSYIGVGDSATGETAAQTGLQASTNKLYVAVDGSYPTYGTSQQAAWRSTFTGAQANYAWNEFTVANGNSDSATNLNRKVSAQGTKTSGQTWQPTCTITWS